MSRREIQSEGKDVATAIIRGLNELGRRRDQVEVTVIQEEKSGFLGIGGRPAIVRIIEKKWDSEHSTPMKPRSAVKASASSARKGRGGKRGDFKKGGRKAVSERVKTPKENEPQKLPSEEIQNAIVPENMKPALAHAKETLETMISAMGVKTENLNVWWDDKQQRILLTFDCDHPAIVIGKEGKTLESIQYLVTLVVSRQFNTPISVMADTQNYWRKLEDKINSEITRALSMLKRTKRVYRFRPMSAQMRRYIHRFLADNLEITTVSEGEGKWRKVVIKPEPRTAAAVEEEKQNFIEQEAAAEDIAKHSADEISAETTANAESSGTAEAAENRAEENSAAEAIKAETCDTISADNASCDCVLTAESTSCECVADVKEQCAENTANAETAEAKAEENSAAEAIKAETCDTISADNASCDCVLTAESTSCECVADVKEQCAETTANAETAETAENRAEENSAAEAIKAETCDTISADNASCDCVLTAESTSCECVADVKEQCAETAANDETAETKEEEHCCGCEHCDCGHEHENNN